MAESDMEDANIEIAEIKDIPPICEIDEGIQQKPVKKTGKRKSEKKGTCRKCQRSEECRTRVFHSSLEHGINNF